MHLGTDDKSKKSEIDIISMTIDAEKCTIFAQLVTLPFEI